MNELGVVGSLEVAVLYVVAPTVAVHEASELLAHRRSGGQAIRRIGLRGARRHVPILTETPQQRRPTASRHVRMRRAGSRRSGECEPAWVDGTGRPLGVSSVDEPHRGGRDPQTGSCRSRQPTMVIGIRGWRATSPAGRGSRPLERPTLPSPQAPVRPGRWSSEAPRSIALQAVAGVDEAAVRQERRPDALVQVRVGTHDDHRPGHVRRLLTIRRSADARPAAMSGQRPGTIRLCPSTRTCWSDRPSPA